MHIISRTLELRKMNTNLDHYLKSVKSGNNFYNYFIIITVW